MRPCLKKQSLIVNLNWRQFHSPTLCLIGIIDGNLDERILLEREIQENACTIDHLEQELLCVSGRVPKFEEEQQQIQEERSLLSRQKEAMGAGAGPVEQRMY